MKTLQNSKTAIFAILLCFCLQTTVRTVPPSSPTKIIHIPKTTRTQITMSPALKEVLAQQATNPSLWPVKKLKQNIEHLVAQTKQMKLSIQAQHQEQARQIKDQTEKIKTIIKQKIEQITLLQKELAQSKTIHKEQESKISLVKKQSTASLFAGTAKQSKLAEQAKQKEHQILEQVASLKSELSSMQVLLKDAESKLKAKETEIKNNLISTQATNTELAIVQSTNERLKKHLDLVKNRETRKMLEVQTEIGTVKTELASIALQITNAQTEIEKKGKAILTLDKSESEAQKISTTQLKTEITRYKEEVSSAQTMLKNAQKTNLDTISTTLSAIQNFRHELTSLQQDTQKALATIEPAKLDQENLKKQLQETEKKLTELTNQTSATSKTSATLQAASVEKMTKFGTDVVNLKEELHELTKQVEETIKVPLEKAKLENEKLKQKIETSKKGDDDFMSQLEQEIAQTEEHVKKLETENTELKKENKELKEKIEKLEKEQKATTVAPTTIESKKEEVKEKPVVTEEKPVVTKEKPITVEKEESVSEKTTKPKTAEEQKDLTEIKNKITEYQSKLKSTISQQDLIEKFEERKKIYLSLLEETIKLAPYGWADNLSSFYTDERGKPITSAIRFITEQISNDFRQAVGDEINKSKEVVKLLAKKENTELNKLEVYLKNYKELIEKELEPAKFTTLKTKASKEIFKEANNQYAKLVDQSKITDTMLENINSARKEQEESTKKAESDKKVEAERIAAHQMVVKNKDTMFRMKLYLEKKVKNKPINPKDDAQFIDLEDRMSLYSSHIENLVSLSHLIDDTSFKSSERFFNEALDQEILYVKNPKIEKIEASKMIESLEKTINSIIPNLEKIAKSEPKVKDCANKEIETLKKFIREKVTTAKTEIKKRKK